MSSLRVIDDERDLSSADGLAGDEALALAVAERSAPPTLRLYTYRPCVIVGRYQNLTDAIDVEECERRGIEWNRRHTGGGTVLMGPGQMAIGLALPDERGRFAGSIRSHFEFFAGALGQALGRFGICAELAGKNDLQVDDRKIAGLAISQDVDGAVFFHGSLLLDFDVALMVNVLRLATCDLDDRGQSCFSQRMTTVREHAPDAAFDAIAQAITESFAGRLASVARRESWSPGERDVLQRLRRDRYENNDWIYSTRVMRRWNGMAERKTPGGLLRVYVSVSGPALESVLITGDYFCRNADLARLETDLKGVPTRRESIQAAIERRECGTLYRIGTDVLADIIVQASQTHGRRAPLALEPAEIVQGGATQA